MYIIAYIVAPLISLFICNKFFPLKFDKLSSYSVIAAVFLLSGLCGYLLVFGLMKSNMWDTEIHNGYVTHKSIKKESCLYPGWYDHSDWFCTNESTRRVFSHYEYYTDSEGKRKREAVYKTQYKYKYPWERKFYVYSTLRDYQIDRVDEQGAIVPPRWESVNINDPVSVKKSYENILLIADKNIVNPSLKKISKSVNYSVPSYPDKVYDYYQLNRVVTLGTEVDYRSWNRELSFLNSRVGPYKQANVILFISNRDQSVRNEIYYFWNGAKKNDIVIFLGIKDGKIEWTDAITFLNNRNNGNFVSKLRNLQEKELSVNILKDIEHLVVSDFNRAPMKDAEFLKKFYNPPLSHKIASGILSLVMSLAMFYFLSQHQPSRLYRR